MYQTKIKEITREQANDIINSSDIEGQYKPRGLFMYREDNVFVGIDNLRGYCWVEEFNTEEACRK